MWISEPFVPDHFLSHLKIVRNLGTDRCDSAGSRDTWPSWDGCSQAPGGCPSGECELSVPRPDSLRELRNAGLNIKSFSFWDSTCLFKHHAQQIIPAISFQHKTKYQTSSLQSLHDNLDCWLCFFLCLWGICLFVCLFCLKGAIWDLAVANHCFYNVPKPGHR